MPTDVWPVAVSHVSDGGLCRKSYSGPVAVSHVSDGGLCRKSYSGRWSWCYTSRIAVTLVKQEI